MNTFVPDTKIEAAKVNENFTEQGERIDREAALSRQFSIDRENSDGLALSIFGGNFQGEEVPGQIIDLDPETTTYIELDISVPAIVSNTVGFTPGDIPLHVHETSDIEILTLDDANSDVRGWATRAFDGDADTLEGESAADLRDRSTHTGTQAAATISDFAEAVDDRVAALLVAGSGINVSYDDATNTFTITNGAPLTTEAVQDIVGAMVAAGVNASAVYDDATGTLTIGAPGENLTTENIQDIVAALLVQGTNVTLSYNDGTGQLTVTAAGGTIDIVGLTAETALSDSDSLPFYDASATANRKGTFSNLWALLLGSARTFTNQLINSFTGSGSDDDTQDAIRVRPSGALSTYWRALSVYLATADTFPTWAIFKNGNMGIGVSSNVADGNSIHVVATASNRGTMMLERYSDTNANPFNIQFKRGRGTPSSPTAVQADDNLLAIFANAQHDTGMSSGGKALLRAYAAENWTSTANGTYWQFSATPVGATAATGIMRLGANFVYIGGSADAVASALLELNSTTKGFLTPRMTTTQRDAISSPATGLLIWNSTNLRFERYNGTAWDHVGTRAYNSLNSNTTLSGVHSDVYVDTSGGNRTITLPDAATCPGREYRILKAHASNTLTIARTSSQTINGTAADLTITSIREGFLLKSDGANWEAIFVGAAGMPSGVQSLTDGATITWDLKNQLQSHKTVTLGGNRTLAMSNVVAGAYGVLIVKQDATGSRTLSLPASSKVVDGGAGAITLSTAANAIDIISFFYDGTNYFWSYGKNFS